MWLSNNAVFLQKVISEAKWAQNKKKLKKRNCLTLWFVEYVSIFSGEKHDMISLISFFYICQGPPNSEQFVLTENLEQGKVGITL